MGNTEKTQSWKPRGVAMLSAAPARCNECGLHIPGTGISRVAGVIATFCARCKKMTLANITLPALANG